MKTSNGLLAVFCALLIAFPAESKADKPPKNLLKGKPEWAQSSKHGIMAIEAEADTSGPKRGEKVLRVELPDGYVLDLELDGFERRGPERAVWRGREKGNKDSRATLTVKNGLISGTIRVGEDVFEVRPKNKNKVIIELIDFSTMASCESDDLPPVPLNEGDAPIPAPVAQDPPVAEDGSTHTIDLLSVYTQAARVTAGGTQQMQIQIQAAVDAANTAFIDSNMNARFRLVHTEEISYDESASASGSVDLDWLRTNSSIGTIRNTYGADMVSMVVDRDGFCGVGYVQRSPGASFAAWAFQVTDIDCMGANRTLAHEHGHNMGFEHNPENSSAYPDGASYPWSFAHYVNGQFRTIMSYSNPCTNGCSRVGQWSNPDIDFLGLATGITNQRDNARTGDLTAPICQLFRDTVVPPSGSSILNVPIISGSDDVEEMTEDNSSYSTGYVYESSPDLDATTDTQFHGGEQIIGLRFTNIDIPWGSTVVNSYLKFTSYFTNASPGALSIRAEDSDDAMPFSIGQTNDVSGRTTTSNAVNWNPSAWSSSFETKFSPTLNSLAQEVIDRQGWLPGHDMVFILSGTGDHSIAAFDVDPTIAPTLHIEYRTCAESRTAEHEWQLLGFPCLPSNPTVRNVFSGLDEADYVTGWSVWRLDPGYYYQRLGLDDTLDTQTGYWLFNSGPSYQIDTTGREARSEIIPLTNSSSTGRWNMVGHPHRAPIPWKDVRVIDGPVELTLDEADPDLGGGLGRACSQEPVDASCLVSSTMFVWNGNSYQSYNGSTPLMEGLLDTFDGALVKAYQPGLSLRIPEAPAASEEADSADEPIIDKFRRGDSWFVRLIAESGVYSDPGNALGQFEDSVDGLDKNDLPENRPFGDKYLTIVFPHDEWETDAWSYTSDYRAMTKKPRGEWTFKVLASADVEEVTLRWEGPDEIIKKSRLYDLQTGKKLKAGKNDSYTFELVDGEAEFIFEVK